MTWDQIKLKDIAQIVSGSTPRRNVDEYWGGEIWWTTPKDLSSLEGKYLTSTPDTITQKGYESCSTTILPPNSVLLSSRAPIGLVAINSVPMATNQGFKSFIPDPKQLDSSYLYYWLKANTMLLQSLGRGATFKEISKRIVEDIEIPLPPLAEQQRIAAILDKADALRAKRRATLAKLDTLLQATFLHMFGDPKSESEFPRFRVETLAEKGKGKIRTGPFGSQLLHSEFIDDPNGVMVLGIDNAVQNRFVYTDKRYISHEKYKQLQRYTVHPDDVLITIMATCGRCSIVPEDIPLAINTKHLCCITLNKNKCLPIYLKYAFLLHPFVLRQLGISERGAVMPGLNMGIIKDLSIPLPPLEMQTQFKTFVINLKEQERLFSEANMELANLFHSLQQRAFKGAL